MATKEGTAAGERDDSGVEVRVIGHPIGKGLFATKNFKTGDVIFEERPLVSCQFLWNAAYGYLACDFCIKPLEAAEENASRLAQNPQLSLPFPECCDTKKDTFIECPYCDGELLEGAWVVEDLGGELLEEVLVVSLKGGEVQGVDGLLVCGEIGPQDQPHHPFLHLLELVSLSGGKRG
ncbi:SET and MYND domain-containing protein 5 [Portunus trituberculatus]|uniref:SET and MYND domain-containing protein 5 n=1 Tax=Portunus trituberculatus TaxID=210409 RepID=A0A5B7E9F2_PORTR|nr:SET and MYND domain-containing protein 5 [Portunus trituberculatus]